MIKVSVIIPTWNRGYIIEKTIKSVLDQTMSDLEVLVCDDGSTDDTFEKVSKIKDPRVRWISGAKGGRPAIPRNNGIREAKGEWLAFLDSDDEWIPEKLEKQLKLAEKEGALAVSSNASRFIPGQGISGSYLDLQKERITLDDLLKTNEIVTSSALIHNSLIAVVEGFPEDEKLRTIEDYAFWLRIATQTDFAFFGEQLVIYRDDAENSIRGEEIVDAWLQRKFVFNNFVSWSEKYTQLKGFTDIVNEQYEIAIATRLIKNGKITHEGINDELKFLKDESESIKKSISYRLGFILLHPWSIFLKEEEKRLPLVTVLMPVYNGEKYLKMAIDSILNQTYKNFELLIINDGSTDKSESIISKYSDERIFYVKNEKNLGLVTTLNKGLALAKGDYIARMDCDDISMPMRFEKQVRFMDENDEVGVCGTWIKFFGEGPGIVVKNPVSHREIECKLLFSNPMAHPTVMLRKSFFDRFNLTYSSNYQLAEDFELWHRCVKLFKFHNIPEVLLRYRITAGSETHSKQDFLQETVDSIFRKGLEGLGLQVDIGELRLHKKIGDEISLGNIKKIEEVKEHILRLYGANHRRSLYPVREFDKMLSGYWFIICTKFTGSFMDVFRIYLSVPFNKRLIVWYFLFRFHYLSFRSYVFRNLSRIKQSNENTTYC